MEVVALSLLFTLYLTIRYFLVDHDTAADKDLKRFRSGIELTKNGKSDDAHRYFDDAVRQYPKSAIAYAYRGKCQLVQENYFSAIYDLTQAINLDNTLADCYLDRGIAYYNTNEFQLAFREFDKAVWHFHDDQPDAYRWRALARIQLRQLPRPKTTSAGPSRSATKIHSISSSSRHLQGRCIRNNLRHTNHDFCRLVSVITSRNSCISYSFPDN